MIAPQYNKENKAIYSMFAFYDQYQNQTCLLYVRFSMIQRMVDI